MERPSERGHEARVCARAGVLSNSQHMYRTTLNARRVSRTRILSSSAISARLTMSLFNATEEGPVMRPAAGMLCASFHPTAITCPSTCLSACLSLWGVKLIRKGVAY